MLADSIPVEPGDHPSIRRRGRALASFATWGIASLAAFVLPSSSARAGERNAPARPTVRPASRGTQVPGVREIRAAAGGASRIEIVAIPVDPGRPPRLLSVARAPAPSAPRATAPAGGTAGPAPMAAPSLPQTNHGDLLWIDREHQNAVIGQGDVAMAGDGSSLVAGWWLNNMRTSLYDPLGDAPALWSHAMTGSFEVPVDGSRTGARLASTILGDDLHFFQEATSVPDFEIPFPPNQVGLEVAVSRSGALVVAAAKDATSSAGWVGGFDGATGSLLWTYTGLGKQPEGLVISDDEAWVAVSERPMTHVLDATNGTLRGTANHNGDTQARPALSGDGSMLVTGNLFGRIRLFRWSGSAYALDWQFQVPPTQFFPFVQDVAIDPGGTTIAAGVLDFVTSSSFGGSLSVFDPASSTPLWTDSSFGDSIDSVDVSRDGSRVIACSYGAFSGSQGNVVAAYDRGSSTPFFAVPDGAVAGAKTHFAVSLDDGGLFAGSGGKAVHARTFGNGGFVAAYALPRNSKRGLNISGTAQIGGSVSVNAAGPEGEFTTGFLSFAVQPGIPTPWGPFYLSSPGPFFLWTGLIPSGGVLATPLAIPINPQLAGVRFWVQGYMSMVLTPAQGDFTNLAGATIQ